MGGKLKVVPKRNISELIHRHRFRKGTTIRDIEKWHYSSLNNKVMFITEEDYKVVIGDNALKVISQVSPENRTNAEAEAREEIAGYLRPKYDCTAIFSAQDEHRNRLIVMYTCDISLYHMSAAMPQKMGSEIRKERYERAIKWLEGVQAGKIVPDLPLAVGEDGLPSGNSLVYSCQKQLHHNW